MFRRTLAWLPACLVMLSPAPIYSVQTQVLGGHVPAAAAHAQVGTRLPASRRLDIIIGLPLRNRENLTNLLQQLQDRSSPNYRHYLTPEEFTARFGPKAEDYAAVEDFARAHGLKVKGRHSNRTLLEVNGSVQEIENAFHVRLHSFRHPKEPRSYFAPDTEPSLDLDTPVLAISGLDNYTLPHPRSLKRAAPNAAADAAPRSGSGPAGNYLGNDFRAAYLPGVSLTGTGQIVGLIEFDSYYTNDITRYENLAGLPNVPLEDVHVSGFDGTPGGANVEVALDIEMAIAMAPGLSKVIVYEAPNVDSVSVDNALLNQAAVDNRAKQISCSWGFSVNPSTDQIFQQFVVQGVSFLLASGDSDAFSTFVDSPSDNPYVTVVGGTTLTTTGPGGAWVSETAWNWGFVSGHGYVGTSGGISQTFPIPSWQQSVDMSANQGSTVWRNLPDVALTADNIWVTYGDGTSGSFGGTSCAAPLWAGLIALANEQGAAMGVAPVGFLNPALYALGAQTNYASCFHDITTGNNFNSISLNKFSAVGGYDLCTGWGTPAGTNLINVLLPLLQITPAQGFIASGPLDGAFNVNSQTFLLASASASPLEWTVGNTSAWLNVSPAGGIVPPGGPPTPVTVSIAETAAGLAPGIYTANIWFSNSSDVLPQTRSFELRVGQPLVQNGGFETGSFSSWTLSGVDAASYLSVVSHGALINNLGAASPVNGSVFVHSGSYGTELGENGSVGFLGQTLPTFPGRAYLLSFWLENPYGGTPSEYVVKWAGTTLLEATDMPAFGWTNVQIVATAGGTSTDLELGFRNDPNAFALDDVSVIPVPPPVFQWATRTGGTLNLSWTALPGVAYQLQYTSSLAAPAWIEVGPAIIATNSIMTASDIPPGGPTQRFYRVWISH